EGRRDRTLNSTSYFTASAREHIPRPIRQPAAAPEVVHHFCCDRNVRHGACNSFAAPGSIARRLTAPTPNARTDREVRSPYKFDTMSVLRKSPSLVAAVAARNRHTTFGAR